MIIPYFNRVIQSAKMKLLSTEDHLKNTNLNSVNTLNIKHKNIEINKTYKI